MIGSSSLDFHPDECFGWLSATAHLNSEPLTARFQGYLLDQKCHGTLISGLSQAGVFQRAREK
jgi:hypothetical protein